MRSIIGRIAPAALLVVMAGCVSTPQTKALITPVGAIGYHTFSPPQPQRPTPSEIDRMVANVKHSMSSREQAPGAP